MRRRTMVVAASASLALGGWALSPLLQVSTAGSAAAAGTTVDCDAGDSLARAVAGAQTGDVLTVLGTCTESVHVPRTIQQLTIDGGGRATVVGPDAEAAPTGPSAFTFFVEGEGVTIQGLEIRGGFHAVHLSGPSSATIVGNTITNSNGAIHLDKGSIGQIAGNTITNNIGYGINVQEDSYARIGFTAPTRGLVPNRITDNDGDGIRIDRWARAWVSGNEVTGNGGSGVVVDRGSHAEVADNLIGANGEDGLAVRRDSGLILTPEGEESATQVAGNRTNTANGGVGLRCDTDSYVSGTLGTLRGREGTYEVDKTCEGELKTPKGRKPLHP
jgi:parallel beta-helix repeat protein